MNRLIATLVLAVTLISVIISGCSRTTLNGTPSEEHGLKIVGATEGLGGSPSNTDEQHLSYEMYLENFGDHKIRVDWVEPVLSKHFTERLQTKDIRITVGKEVSPRSTIKIRGDIYFSASGLSKVQIVDLSNISGFRVSSEQILPMRGR